MKIQKQDVYHGCALTQIVEHESFKALNKVDDKYGHYLVNHDRRLMVKYAANAESPWSFTFEVDHLKTMKRDNRHNLSAFLILVCGSVTICALCWGEIEQLVDVNDPSTRMWVKVEVPSPGSRMRVTGSLGCLTKTIPHNRFPEIIFSANGN